ncbi:MAG: VOC family protein [Planctomycetota bacterium]
MVGSIVWTEISTSDVAAATKFYTKVFGWKAKVMEQMGGYVILGESQTGPGMMKSEGGPPMWVSYVDVKDVDKSASVVTSAGGKILAPPMEVPTVGRIAICQDPQGAVFGLFKPAPRPAAGGSKKKAGGKKKAAKKKAAGGAKKKKAAAAPAAKKKAKKKK